MRQIGRFAAAGMAAAFGMLGCSSGNPDSIGLSGEGGVFNPNTPTDCELGSVSCKNGRAVSCEPDGKVSEDCEAEGQTCHSGLGCVVCSPGEQRCDDDDSVRCAPDGSGFEVTRSCDPHAGWHCDAETGSCRNRCQESAADFSNAGCEYWPVPTANFVDKDFDYAIAVSNPNDVDVGLTIDSGDDYASQHSVPAGEVATIVLPWKHLSGDGNTYGSTGDAYHLLSELPVTVYQFSPLQYQIDRDCEDELSTPSLVDGTCFSRTNDASLLLPTPVLTSNYMISARPSFYYSEQKRSPDGGPALDRSGQPIPDHGERQRGGTITLVAIGEEPVEVTVHFTGVVENGLDVDKPFQPGDSTSFVLARGRVRQLLAAAPDSQQPCEDPSTDVAEVRCTVNGELTDDICRVDTHTYCRPLPGYDLTGTTIEATGPLAVYQGSPCSFVPFDRRACDHLEESVAPLETWGKDYLVAITKPLDSEPNILRVLSGKNNNTITFEPAVHEPVTLDRGEWVEFASREHFRATGKKAFSIAQYLVGQDHKGHQANVDRVAAGEISNGDPSLTLVPPIEQYRDRYNFLTPDSYDQSWVAITAPNDTTVMLDGGEVKGLQKVGDTGMSTVRIALPAGTHNLEADAPVGIQVYGFGSFTSYMYPGGLNLHVINPVIF